MTAHYDFLVGRNDLRESRMEPATPEAKIDLGPGEILVRVERFALTANNITYAAFGDAMKYWNFFPGPEGWGRVPVWGYGEIVRSNADGIAAGERIYGYFPMSSHLVMKPERVRGSGFSDGAAHRQGLPSVYNDYQRLGANAPRDATAEDHRMILWPLFTTSFLIDDFLADNDFFGAKQVLVLSASSKTAIGLAFLLHRNRRGQVEVVGLTSPGNKAFVESLGCYDRVVTYDQIPTLPVTQDAVSVDMAGSKDVLTAVHTRFGDRLKHSCIVGASHWEERGTAHDLPGAKPTFFFAPNQIAKRTKDWGGAKLQQTIGEAWTAFMPMVGGWMKVHHGQGPAEMERVYRAVLENRTRPDEGFVIAP